MTNFNEEEQKYIKYARDMQKITKDRLILWKDKNGYFLEEPDCKKLWPLYENSEGGITHSIHWEPLYLWSKRFWKNT